MGTSQCANTETDPVPALSHSGARCAVRCVPFNPANHLLLRAIWATVVLFPGGLVAWWHSGCPCALCCVADNQPGRLLLSHRVAISGGVRLARLATPVPASCRSGTDRSDGHRSVSRSTLDASAASLTAVGSGTPVPPSLLCLSPPLRFALKRQRRWGPVRRSLADVLAAAALCAEASALMCGGGVEFAGPSLPC